MSTAPPLIPRRIVSAMRGRRLWHEAPRAALQSAAPIFIYHAISGTPVADPYVLTEQLFREHLQIILASRRPVTHLLESRGDGLALTFDDGCTSWLSTVAPLLLEHDLPATFFLIADRTAERGSIARPEPLVWRDVRALADTRGRDGQPLFEIGCHGLRHENLAARYRADGADVLCAELTQARDCIEQHTGRPCQLLAIPGGKTGDRPTDRAALRQIAARAGFVRVRDSLPRYDRDPARDCLGGSPVYAHTSAAMLQFEIARARRGNLRNTAHWLFMRGTGRWIETAPAHQAGANHDGADRVALSGVHIRQWSFWYSPRPAEYRRPCHPSVITPDESQSEKQGATPAPRRLRLTWHVPRFALQGCGMSRRVRDLTAGLAAYGHDQQIIAPTGTGETIPPRVDSIPLVAYSISPARSLHWSLQARARARTAAQMAAALHDPGDALLTTQPEFAAAARRRFPDLPIVLVACCSQLLYEPDDRAQSSSAGISHQIARALNRQLLRAGERRGFRAASLIAFDSQMTRDIVVPTYGLDEQRCHVLTPCVDTDRFVPVSALQRIALRKKLDLPPTDFTLCWTGRLEDRKNVALLMDAIAHAPDVVKHVLLIGDGADRTRLKARAQTLGLDSIIRFEGSRADVLPYLQAADAFVLPSLVESFGIALLEAMACGLPCIALSNDIPTVQSNAAHLLEGGRGLLLKTTDPDELAQRLRELAASPETCRTLGSAARAFALKHHAVGRDADQLENLLERLTTG